MAKITLIIDHCGHEELENYLTSLKGILSIMIQKKEKLEIYIKYNPNIITPKIIKIEILLFLNIINTPSILAFDKHSSINTNEYKIIIDNLCCEYCFKGAIDDLLEIEGIEKIESNFSEELYYNRENKIIINIKYNPNLLSFEDMKQIETKLNF